MNVCIYRKRVGTSHLTAAQAQGNGMINNSRLVVGFYEFRPLPTASQPSKLDGAKEAEKVCTTEMLKLLISYRLFEAALVVRSRKKNTGGFM